MREKSMRFSESRRTMKEGTFTTCLRTLEIEARSRVRLYTQQSDKERAGAPSWLELCGVLRQDIPNVTLADTNTGIVDGLGKMALEHLGLEATLEEILNLETKDVIELHVLLVKDTGAHKTTEKGITLEETAGVLTKPGRGRRAVRGLYTRPRVHRDRNKHTFSSRVRSSRAALRILARVSLTRHTWGEARHG